MMAVKWKCKGESHEEKYIITYIVLLAILLIMRLTHGIPFGIMVSEIDELYGIVLKINKHIVLIYNIVIMLGCLVGTILVTVKKDNTFSLKWLIPIVMLISFLFLPIGMSKHICIQPNETFIEMWSLVSLAMRWFACG